MSSGYEVSSNRELRIEVKIDDPEPIEGFTAWHDYAHAVWNEREGWWDMRGANMGSNNALIVHPYQVEPLIALLQAMRDAKPFPPVASEEAAK